MCLNLLQHLFMGLLLLFADLQATGQAIQDFFCFVPLLISLCSPKNLALCGCRYPSFATLKVWKTFGFSFMGQFTCAISFYMLLHFICNSVHSFIYPCDTFLSTRAENVWTGPGHCLANFAREKRCINTWLGSGPDVISTWEVSIMFR
jgi:hypothetical protein